MPPVKADNIVTESMMEEEVKMEEKSKSEDKQFFEEMKEKEENATREMCYKRLEHLLSRSNFYTQFLLKRMKEQQDHKERKRKIQADKAKENSSPPQVTETRKSLRQVNVVDSKENANKSNSTQLKAKNGVKRKITSKSKLSNQLNISDFYSEESLAKRPKLEAEDNGKSGKNAADSFCRTINGEKVSDRQPKLFCGGVMRNYQLDGLDWLKLLYENGVNGILGDEMGLGKTIQCIALISHLVEMGVPGPFLVCAPLSTLPNWISEFERFTPQVPVVLYHGSQDERADLLRQVNKSVNVNGRSTKTTLVTSYEIAMRDRIHLSRYHWRYLIVDEGHRIKNFNCRLVRELKSLNTANRLLLTGTPLQNNLSELWSLLNFLLPEIFDDLQVFQSWFDVTMLSDAKNDDKIVEQEQEKQIIAKLHQILTPFLLRRVKADVALNIPPKKELLVYAPMSELQQKYYSATVDKTIENMLNPPKEEEPIIYNENGRPSRKSKKKINYDKYLNPKDEDCFEIAEDVGQLVPVCTSHSISSQPEPRDSVVSLTMRNTLMQLKKICNHPYLVEYPLLPGTDCYRIDEEIITSCGKMQILDHMLKRLQANGHKVLIFSQMTKLMDILGDFCEHKEYQYCRLDGTMNIQDRQEEIKTFNTDPDMFLFLLSTRAGGLGINLTAADTVIIFDSDWNPQCDLQAQDRCHRIGQTKPVVVYRFVTSGTIDEKIVERASSKRKLEKMIIHKGKFKSGRASIENSLSALSANELLDILKSKDHQKVSSCSNGKMYTEQELDELMDRSDLISDQKKNIPDQSSIFKVVSHDNISDITF